MEQLLNNPSISQYLQNGLTASIMFLIVGLFALYFFRNAIKSLVAGVLGYRTFLDDYSFSMHKNRDTIYDNEVVRLTTGINLKNGLLLILSILSALINPLIFAGSYIAYKYFTIKEKFLNTKDYKIYDSLETDDMLIKWLNTKTSKINLVVDELWTTSYIFIAAGLYFSNTNIAFIGIILAATVLIATLFLIYNIGMYRLNYKQVLYYRALRLLSSSSLSNSRSLFILGFLGFISNFTDIAGFSVFIWFVFAIKLIINLTVSTLLKREDDISAQHQLIENRNYQDLEEVASYPNATSQSRGYKWTTALQMKFFQLENEESKKELIHINNYAFYPQMINRSVLRKNPLLTETVKNSINIKFETLRFTEQILILGKMGSGKTEQVNYIIEQVHNDKFNNFKSIAYNDTKGDFTQKFYRPKKDIIVNLFDSRAKVWNVFEEMNYNYEAATSFINNLFESLQGAEKDFFVASAKQKTAQWLQQSYFNTNNSFEAWEMFFKKISDYEKDIKERDDKTQSSIFANIQIALEILQIMYYQVCIEKRDTFTFTDFVNAKDCQLFLQNNKQYEAKLTPYLTGLTATYINTVMAKEDTKEHLILNVFDEFLTMKIDEETRKTLLTATRSKGFCNLLMAQMLTKSDNKLLEELKSSKYAMFVFSVGEETAKQVVEELGKAEILSTQVSPQRQDNNPQNPASNGADSKDGFGAALGIFGNIIPNKKKNNFTYSLNQTEVLLSQQIQSLPKYHHLVYLPEVETKTLSKLDAKRFFRLMAFGYDDLMKDIVKENEFLAKESGVLYLGYTPVSELNLKNAHFEKWEMRDYYLYNSNKENEAHKNFTEKESFIHYLNIKFADSENDAMQYLKDNKLYTVDLKSIYGAAEEDINKVNQFLVKYTDQERYELAEKFFSIDEKDFETKYQFCKENDLIGCILGIFKFSEDFLKTLDEEVTENE